MNKKIEDLMNELIKKSKKPQDYEDIKNMIFKYPFTKELYIFLKLEEEKLITESDFLKINDLNNEINQYIDLFKLSPKQFGAWGEKYVIDNSSLGIVKGSTEFDPNFSGEYDSFFENQKIEIKSSRVVKKEPSNSLEEKALDFDSAQFNEFEMNFQQLKPRFCDWFVFIAVFSDQITCWLISSKDVEENPAYSKGQHRGNYGEGQLWINQKNISSFDNFLTDITKIDENIILKMQERENDLKESEISEPEDDELELVM